MRLKFRRKTLREKIMEITEQYGIKILNIKFSNNYIEVEIDKTTLPDTTIQKIKEKLEKMELIRIG